MKSLKKISSILTIAALATLVACAGTAKKKAQENILTTA